MKTYLTATTFALKAWTQTALLFGHRNRLVKVVSDAWSYFNKAWNILYMTIHISLTQDTNVQRCHKKASHNHELKKVRLLLELVKLMPAWQDNYKLDFSVCMHEETFKRQVEITSRSHRSCHNPNAKHLVMPGAWEPAAGMKQDMSRWLVGIV